MPLQPKPQAQAKCPPGTRRNKQGVCVPFEGFTKGTYTPRKKILKADRENPQRRFRCPPGTRQDKDGNCIDEAGNIIVKRTTIMGGVAGGEEAQMVYEPKMALQFMALEELNRRMEAMTVVPNPFAEPAPITIIQPIPIRATAAENIRLAAMAELAQRETMEKQAAEQILLEREEIDRLQAEIEKGWFSKLFNADPIPTVFLVKNGSYQGDRRWGQYTGDIAKSKLFKYYEDIIIILQRLKDDSIKQPILIRIDGALSQIEDILSILSKRDKEDNGGSIDYLMKERDLLIKIKRDLNSLSVAAKQPVIDIVAKRAREAEEKRIRDEKAAAREAEGKARSLKIREKMDAEAKTKKDAADAAEKQRLEVLFTVATNEPQEVTELQYQESTREKGNWIRKKIKNVVYFLDTDSSKLYKYLLLNITYDGESKRAYLYRGYLDGKTIKEGLPDDEMPPVPTLQKKKAKGVVGGVPRVMETEDYLVFALPKNNPVITELPAVASAFMRSDFGEDTLPEDTFGTTIDMSDFFTS
jgi:hypothetical protein